MCLLRSFLAPTASSTEGRATKTSTGGAAKESPILEKWKRLKEENSNMKGPSIKSNSNTFPGVWASSFYRGNAYSSPSWYFWIRQGLSLFPITTTFSRGMSLNSKESDSAPSLVPLIRNLTSWSLFPLLRKIEASSSRKHLQTLRPASRARSLLSLLRLITYSGLSKPWNLHSTMAMFSDPAVQWSLRIASWSQLNSNSCEKSGESPFFSLRLEPCL